MRLGNLSARCEDGYFMLVRTADDSIKMTVEEGCSLYERSSGCDVSSQLVRIDLTDFIDVFIDVFAPHVFLFAGISKLISRPEGRAGFTRSPDNGRKQKSEYDKHPHSHMAVALFVVSICISIN